VEGCNLRARWLLTPLFLASIGALLICCLAAASSGFANPFAAMQSETRSASSLEEGELQKGIALTRQGLFADAIPHFLAAREHVADEYATEFNLALCYVGTKKWPEAIRILGHLKESGHINANVENLLSQAFIGNGQAKDAWQALNRAAELTPNDERLYAFSGDACVDQHDYILGIRVIELGLKHLPNSARLHYQRAYFLSLLDRFDEAQSDFDFAKSLAPQSEIAALAEAQKNFLTGNMPEAIRVARAAVRERRANYVVLTILGEALLRSGAVAGLPEFTEAESALRKSIESKPSYARSHVALGYLLLISNRLDDSLMQLEQGRELDSRNPAVYAHLGVLYRKNGQTEKAKEMLAMLAKLNADEAVRISEAPGDRKLIP
jgi:tetratricopeptide (TPR) repeat protein